MNKKDIQLLYDFDRWAASQQHAVIATLSGEQYNRNLGSSFGGGIHGTLVHIYGAQRIWLDRWKGNSPSSLPGIAELPTLSVLTSQWDALRQDQDAFLRSLTEEKLEEPLTFKTLKGEPSTLPLWQQMQHVVNHSTYHRGQVTTLLRQLDVTPVGTDLITYYRTL